MGSKGGAGILGRESRLWDLPNLGLEMGLPGHLEGPGDKRTGARSLAQDTGSLIADFYSQKDLDQ